MSFVCMCASEDCQVNGCRRYRALQRPPEPIIVTDPKPVKRSAKTVRRGWTCPECGRGVSPDVKVCPCQT